MNVCSVCQRCYEDEVSICAEVEHGNLTHKIDKNRAAVEGYRLDQLIDNRSNEEIYRAAHLPSQKEVLINFIKTANDSADKLQPEVAAVFAVNHPHLARVYEFGKVTNEEFYLVQESAGGQTLEEYLKGRGRLPERDAILIARQIAEALETLHGANVIHRAINPRNIVFTEAANSNLTVKLQNFDFGGIRQTAVVASANRVDAQTDALAYLSPEQISAAETDAQTDIYSLGVVLYEMLSGALPYSAPNTQAILNYVFSDRPFETLRFDVRALISHLLKESLQKRTNLRPPKAGTLARQLRHIEQLVAPAPIAFRDYQAPPVKTPVVVPQIQPAVLPVEQIVLPVEQAAEPENFQFDEPPTPETAQFEESPAAEIVQAIDEAAPQTEALSVGSAATEETASFEEFHASYEENLADETEIPAAEDRLSDFAEAIPVMETEAAGQLLAEEEIFDQTGENVETPERMIEESPEEIVQELVLAETVEEFSAPAVAEEVSSFEDFDEEISFSAASVGEAPVPELIAEEILADEAEEAPVAVFEEAPPAAGETVFSEFVEETSVSEIVEKERFVPEVEEVEVEEPRTRAFIHLSESYAAPRLKLDVAEKAKPVANAVTTAEAESGFETLDYETIDAPPATEPESAARRAPENFMHSFDAYAQERQFLPGGRAIYAVAGIFGFLVLVGLTFGYLSSGQSQDATLQSKPSAPSAAPARIEQAAPKILEQPVAKTLEMPEPKAENEVTATKTSARRDEISEPVVKIKANDAAIKNDAPTKLEKNPIDNKTKRVSGNTTATSQTQKTTTPSKPLVKQIVSKNDAAPIKKTKPATPKGDGSTRPRIVSN